MKKSAVRVFMSFASLIQSQQPETQMQNRMKTPTSRNHFVLLGLLAAVPACVRGGFTKTFPARLRPLALALLGLALVPDAPAASDYWSASTSGVQTDGSGTWTSANQWVTSQGGSSHITWSSGDTAIIGNGGTAGTITSVATTVNGITFNSGVSGNYTIAGSSPLTLGLAATPMAVDNSSTISCPLGGAGMGITKTGAGTLTLSGANTYTGATTVSAGRLALSGISASLNAASAVTVAGGAQLWFQSTADGQTFNYNSFPLNLTGQGADNNGAHQTAIFAYNNNGNYNVPGNIAVANGVQFYTYGIQNTINLGGVFSGTGDMSFVTEGLGTHEFDFSGNSSASGYTGSYIFYANGTWLYAKLVGGNNRLPITASVDLESQGGGLAAIFDLNGNSQQLAGLVGGGSYQGNNWVQNSGAGTPTLTISNALADTFTGVLGVGGASFALTKSGSGTLTLSGANTYTGATTVSGGTLSLYGPGANLNAATTVTVAGGAQLWFQSTANGQTLNYNSFPLNLTGQGADNNGAHQTVMFAYNNDGNYNVPGNITVTNGVQFYTYGINNTINLGGVFSGIGDMSFVTDGLGTHEFDFSGNSSASGYTGSYIFYANGTWLYAKLVGGNNRLPITASVDLESQGGGLAAIFDLNGNSQQLAGLVGGGSYQGNNWVQNSGAGTPTLTISNALADTFTGVLGVGGASFALTKSGSGTLTLSGANTYTGATTVKQGTLALGANNVFADSTAVAISNATFNAATFTDTVGTLAVKGAATINLGAGAALAFADSSAIDWTGGTLNLAGTFVSGFSLRFGTSSSGLTSTQLALISATGFGSFALDSSGYLVTLAPPVVVTQPVGGTRYAGGAFTFNAVVSGYPAPTFQWKHAGTNVPGATNATLALSNLSLAAAGSYVLYATNSQGFTNSVAAVLTVIPVSAYGSQILTNNPLGYWRFSDGGGTNAYDYAGDNNAYDTNYMNNGGSGPATLLAGPQPSAFAGFESTNTAPFLDGLSQGYASSVSLFNNRSNFTIMGWFKIDPTQYPFVEDVFVHPQGRASLFGQEWAAELGFYQGTNLYFYATGITPGTIFVTSGFNPGVWHFVAAVSDAGANTTKVYLDGVVAGTANACPGTANSYLFSIGKNVAYFPSGGYDNAFFPGSIDEVATFDHALSTSTIQALYNVGIAGSVNQSPTNMTVTVSSGQMTLAWPQDHTGWVLQAQTNALNAGLGTNWVRIPSSATTNQVTVPVSPANPTVFYRLVYP